MTYFEDKDTSWRVGAVFRSCVRHHMSRDMAREKLAEILDDADKAESLTEIWFREDPYFRSRLGYEKWHHGILLAEELVGYKPSIIEISRNTWSDHEGDRRAELFLEKNDMPDPHSLQELLMSLTSPSSPGAAFIGAQAHCDENWIRHVSHNEPDVALHYAFKLEAMSNRKLNVEAELKKILEEEYEHEAAFA